MFNNVQEPSPVEAAKLEVTKLFEAERGLEDRRRQTLMALAGIEAGAGQMVADGESIENASRQIVQGQAEIRVVEQGTFVGTNYSFGEPVFTVGAAA